MTTWEEIRDEVAGTLADGQPLEDVIAKLEKRKNEMAKPMTNEEWFASLPTEEKATFLAIQVRLGVEFYRTDDERYQDHDWWVRWLKQPHTIKE